MEPTNLFIYNSLLNRSAELYQEAVTLIWQPIKTLPFPLSLSLPGRTLISFFLVMIAIVGSTLRGLILAFLNEPEVNLGPINFLLWIDQVCDVFINHCISIETLKNKYFDLANKTQ